MSRKPLVQSVKDFMLAEWDLDPPSDTFVKLYRGQTDSWPLLPSLFRPCPNSDLTHERAYGCEQDVLILFKQEGRLFLPSTPDDEWNWLSIAQHFGLPTRLSDWSSSPLIGLFFAVEI